MPDGFVSHVLVRNLRIEEDPEMIDTTRSGVPDNLFGSETAKSAMTTRLTGRCDPRRRT